MLRTLLIISLLSVSSTEASNYRDDHTEHLKQLSIEDLVTIEVATVHGASRYEQTVTEAPSSVSIILADEIKKYGYRTLADILRSVRSFYVTSDRNYSYAAMRGFGRTGDYNSRFLVLINGHRANDNIYDSVNIGNDFILDVDMIERLEIIRGPSSSLYGNNAFFSIINIVTRSAKNIKGVEASASAGSHDTYAGRFSFGTIIKSGLKMSASASVLDSKGQNLFFREFNSPDTNFGVAQNCDRERNYSFFSQLSSGDFTLEGAYVSRTKGIPTASYDTDFNDPRNRTTDERGYLYLKYNKSFANRSVIMGRLYYDIYDYRGNYIYSGLVNNDFSKGRWWGGEVMVTTMLKTHKLTAGAEYQRNVKQNQGSSYEEPFKIILDDKRDSERWALYIQDEFKIFSNLILNAGVRHDNYSEFHGTTNPRFALIYSPHEKTIFKLIYGTAFRAPNVFELYYSVIGEKGNPHLKPETIRTYEIICEHSLTDNILLSVSGFRNLIKDLIVSEVDPADDLLIFKNSRKAEAKGVELELEGRWDSGITGRISYTLQEAKDTTTGNIMVNSPRHIAKVNMIIPILRDTIFAGFEEQYMSRRKTNAGTKTEGVFLTHLTLFSQQMITGVEVSATVYNLFDNKYSDPGSTEHTQVAIEQNGRSFRFKLTFTF